MNNCLIDDRRIKARHTCFESRRAAQMQCMRCLWSLLDCFMAAQLVECSFCVLKSNVERMMRTRLLTSHS